MQFAFRPFESFSVWTQVYASFMDTPWFLLFVNVVCVRMFVCMCSMGGHGALTLFLKNREKYQSVSAFSPVCNPMQCRWGQKAFNNYLGDTDKEAWKAYDACELVKAYKGAKDFRILIDQGTKDGFLCHGDDDHDQLRPSAFADACRSAVLCQTGAFFFSFLFLCCLSHALCVFLCSLYRSNTGVNCTYIYK